MSHGSSRITSVACCGLLVIGLGLAGCRRQSTPEQAPAAPAAVTAGTTPTNRFYQARQGLQPGPLPPNEAAPPPDVPPPEVFQLVSYSSPVGPLAAYVTPDPGDGQRHPAIVWITGGDCNSIGDVWTKPPADNDQTAGAYREAGIAMMFPSLRGGNNNPGQREFFFGELEDIRAATDYLASLPYIDPTRIYLGGHSTGGTMALLMAEYSDRYRAVFSFGPAGDIRGYGQETVPINFGDVVAVRIRSPQYWMDTIRSPTFVIEGKLQPGNADGLVGLEQENRNPLLKCLWIPRVHHFSVLAVSNQVIAKKILADTGPTCQLTLTVEEISRGLQP
jgi:hypothetical protein